MRFSIIIPVYNVEKYIRKCLDTIVNQTFRDFEVIVVDDESPDNSMQIVEEYARNYPGMIKMIHQKNTRLGGARNRGVKDAQGEYLLFVDSDDYVSVDLLERVDIQLKRYECDILVFKYRMVTPEGKFMREEGFGPLTPGLYVPKECRQVVMLPVGTVQKVYRRSFYLACNFHFLEGVLYEDTITRLFVAKASCIYLYDAVLYYYVQSPGSIMRQKPSLHVMDILKVTDIVINEFRENGIYDDYREELEASLLTGILHVFDSVNKAEKDSKLQDAFASYIQERFGNFENNPCISKENKKAIACVLTRNYTYYHYRFLRKLELVEALMSYSFMIRLNKIRKSVLSKMKKG